MVRFRGPDASVYSSSGDVPDGVEEPSVLVVVKDDATGDDSGSDESDGDLDGRMVVLVTDVIWTYKGIFLGKGSACLVHRIE